MSEILKDAGNLGLIIVAVGFLLQIIIPGLRNKSLQNGSLQMLKDVHRWLAPDDRGIQVWKNTELVQAVDRLTEAVERLEDTVGRLAEFVEGRSA